MSNNDFVLTLSEEEREKLTREAAVWQPKIMAAYTQALEEDISWKAACKAVGVPWARFRRWLEDPANAALVAQRTAAGIAEATLSSANRLAAMIEDLADASTKTDVSVRDKAAAVDKVTSALIQLRALKVMENGGGSGGGSGEESGDGPAKYRPSFTLRGVIRVEQAPVIDVRPNDPSALA